ncbi:sigma 54-interacting transcriptional regulator, partial [Parasutterella excrementihominis]
MTNIAGKRETLQKLHRLFGHEKGAFTGASAIRHG